MSDNVSDFVGVDFQAVFDASLDAIFILDSNAQILNANRTAVQRYGYSLEELKQMNAAQLAADGLKSEIPVKISNLMQSGEIFEWRHRCKNGDELPVEIISQPIMQQGKQVLYSTVRDLSPRKNIELALQTQKHMLERILDTEPGTVYIFDLIQQQNIYVNRHWLTAYGYTPDETQAMGPELYRVFHPDDLARIVENHTAWRNANEMESRSIEYRIQDKQGNWHWLLSQETPFARDDTGRVSQILGITHDITDRKQSETLLNVQNQVLNMVASGKPLPETLTSLIQGIEALVPGMLGSILLLDSDGVHVHHGAAPSLPAEFIAAVDGQPIGPVAGSCGTAAYRKEAVYAEDINTDPLWEKYKVVAQSNGLRACWSTPIFGSQDQVLGTFAMYYREPGLPQTEHLRLIGTVTHIASIAINRHREEQALRNSENRFAILFGKASLPAVLTHCSDNTFVDVNDAWIQLFGFTKQELTGKTAVELGIENESNQCPPVVDGSVQHTPVRDLEQQLQTKSGNAITVLTNINVVEIDGEHYAISSVQDITERKLVEARLQRLTQLYATLSQCNQAIVRCKTEAELLLHICRDAVKFGGMKMAWIGMIDEAEQWVKPVASYGKGIEYLQDLKISLAHDNPTGHGPTGTAIRDNQPFWCQNFQNDPTTLVWHERGKTFGWGSSASLPLHREGAVVGTFNLYASVVNAFDDAEQDLLIEMAADISFALDRFTREAEHRKIDEALKASEQHLRTIVETEPECVKVLDINGALLEMNAAGLAMLEVDSIEEVKNQSLFDFILPEYHDAFLALHQRILNGKTDTLEFEITGKKGTRRWFGTHAAPMRNAGGKVTSILAITRDITEQKLAEERIQYMANFDTLTGLPNRIQLEDHLKYGISLMKRNNGNLAVLFIDIDHFKDINDTLGHSIGDALLIQISQRVQKQLREEDTASRMGGDEFIVILPDCDSQGAANVAQKLLQVIAEPYQIDAYDLAVSASIGIAIFPDDGDDLETLSKNADTAMYRAKNEGRDAYRFFTGEMQDRAKRNMQLLNALRYALELDQLHVLYQPQISIHDGRIIGAEALLRWQHPELGSISPAEFIPVAEDSRLILPIGEWVLRTAISQLKQWLDKGHPPMVMAVNLSAVQFRHASLPDLVSSILQEAGVPAEYLELELTEGVAMQDAQGVLSMMNNLYERGVRLSIDDFGTGYSSLSYLKKFKVYKLKIDQSFVRDITTDIEDKAIVAAIIGMARNLGLQTIAEGVETAEQLTYLREQGCDEAQGYFFSKPLPAVAIEKLITGVKPDSLNSDTNTQA